MNTIVQRVSGWMDAIERVFSIIIAFMLGFLAFLVGWQVVARYIFNTGIFWAEELALLSMMWATMLGAAGCIRTDSHVRLNILIDRLPARVRLWLLTIMDGVVLWFAFWIVKEGIVLAQRTMGGQMSALRIPIGTTYIILPVAAVFMMLFTVVKMFERIVGQSLSKGGTR
ncbi:TRAP dicarboxylate transporter [Candidatus Vecturithrix granuli]|uniref:TRAP dicarboxylate transporter n=1 Tax=Vecturithrix granuli TaxID=1499967 RepID=A0A081C7Q6_VECG1|nr:TRAP dicarboxylate transporter [Candidatus Vecturithrix granuli]